jgi:hypothetical protein
VEGFHVLDLPRWEEIEFQAMHRALGHLDAETLQVWLFVALGRAVVGIAIQEEPFHLPGREQAAPGVAPLLNLLQTQCVLPLAPDPNVGGGSTEEGAAADTEFRHSARLCIARIIGSDALVIIAAQLLA